MNLIPTWPIAVGALAVGMLAGAGADHAVMSAKLAREELRYTKLVAEDSERERQRAVKRSEDERAAREKEQIMAARAGQIEQEKTNAIEKIRVDSAAAIARLQQRPDRKPAGAGGLPAPAAACAGSTGAELSRQDGSFLAGEAARANELRAGLAACYGWADSVEQGPQPTGQGK